MRQRNRDRPPPEPSAELPSPVRPNATLAEFAREWLKTRNVRTRQADTQRLRDHVLSLLGSRRLRDIRTDDVASVVRQMLAKKGMNLKSARNAHAVFVDLLGDALEKGLIGEDPRQLPADVWPEEEAAAVPRFSLEEAHALMHDERLDADQRIFNTLAFYSGLESSDICQLRFEDWSSRVAATARPELGAVIARWQQAGFESVYGRPPTGSDWLVPRRSDVTSPHGEGSAYKAFRRACVSLGIKTRSPRAVLSTFAENSAGSSD